MKITFTEKKKEENKKAIMIVILAFRIGKQEKKPPAFTGYAGLLQEPNKKEGKMPQNAWRSYFRPRQTA